MASEWCRTTNVDDHHTPLSPGLTESSGDSQNIPKDDRVNNGVSRRNIELPNPQIEIPYPLVANGRHRAILKFSSEARRMSGTTLAYQKMHLPQNHIILRPNPDLVNDFPFYAHPLAKTQKEKVDLGVSV
jgi:hypothetical protein